MWSAIGSLVALLCILLCCLLTAIRRRRRAAPPVTFLETATIESNATGELGAMGVGELECAGEEDKKPKEPRADKGMLIRIAVGASRREMTKKGLRVPKLSFRGKQKGGRVGAAAIGTKDGPSLLQTYRDSKDTVRSIFLMSLPSATDRPPNAGPNNYPSKPSELDHVVKLAVLETHNGAHVIDAGSAVNGPNDSSLAVLGSGNTLPEHA